MCVRSPCIPHDDTPCSDHHRDIEMICAGRFPAASVEWLWPNRIPIGKVTLLVGDPGCGKSLVALDIAARVSRGAPWPDELAESRATRVESLNSESGSPLSTLDSRLPGSVLVLSAEDDLTDTIRPRLEAAAADCSRVFVLPAIADLRHDFAQLAAAVNRASDCRLIIVDPINAYVGPNDSHFQTIVRNVLAPLARLAAEGRIAVLAIAHFRKTHGAAIYRAAGSMGFVSAARTVWTLCRDHSQPGRHYFLPLKTNLTSAARGLAYFIETHPSGNPAVYWEPIPVTISAEVALAPPPKLRAEPATERAAARLWLRETLAAGPRPASTIQEEGKLCGFLPRTLRRAFHEINGHTAKKGLLRGWWRSLNDQNIDETASDTQKTADPFEGVTYEKDVADQRQHDEVANFQPPVVNCPPPPDIPPITIDPTNIDATIAELGKTFLQQSEKLRQFPAIQRTTRPRLDSS